MPNEFFHELSITLIEGGVSDDGLGIGSEGSDGMPPGGMEIVVVFGTDAVVVVVVVVDVVVVVSGKGVFCDLSFG